MKSMNQSLGKLAINESPLLYSIKESQTSVIQLRNKLIESISSQFPLGNPLFKSLLESAETELSRLIGLKEEEEKTKQEEEKTKQKQEEEKTKQEAKREEEKTKREKEKTKQVLLLGVGKKSSTSKSFSTLKSEEKVETLEFDGNELKSKFEKRWIMTKKYNKCNNHLFL